MDQLLRAYDAADHRLEAPAMAGAEFARVDRTAADVVTALRMTRATKVTLVGDEAWANVEGLALWRALRNILDNACRAAGDDGRVVVRVFVEDGWSVAQVDDDGPGFGAGPAGLASLGLGIVQDFAAEHGGDLEFLGSDLGGCRVRILLPAVLPPPSASRLD